MTWLITVPAILLAGIASGWLAGSGNRNAWFRALEKPWFMPPGWAFPVAWTTLYVLMAVALARVIDRPGPGQRIAVLLFAAQFALNLAWSPVFFAMHRLRGALAVILLLDAAVVATIVDFARVDGTAAALLLPYLAWLLLATALNGAILRMNG